MGAAWVTPVGVIRVGAGEPGLLLWGGAAGRVGLG